MPPNDNLPPIIPLASDDAVLIAGDQLVFKKENTYFNLLLVISIFGWLVLLLTIFGIFYALLIGLAAWMASGLLAARLKSESVELTRDQLPVLFNVYEEVCTKLGLKELPAFYLLQSNGLLNAFASRHSGRNFVVIYSNLLEALGYDSPQVRFLIGHEIGHVRRNHILKRLLLMPSVFVPLLGKAYHRACEATCDRFGAAAAGTLSGATRGLLVLGSGKETAPKLDPKIFARQYHNQRGFFVSWHEVASGYPTLSQRVSKVLGLKYPEFNQRAPRNPLAYLFAPIFTLQTLVILYLLIVFGSLALPAIQAAKAKAHAMEELRQERNDSSLNP